MDAPLHEDNMLHSFTWNMSFSWLVAHLISLIPARTTAAIPLPNTVLKAP